MLVTSLKVCSDLHRSKRGLLRIAHFNFQRTGLLKFLVEDSAAPSDDKKPDTATAQPRRAEQKLFAPKEPPSNPSRTNYLPVLRGTCQEAIRTFLQGR